VVAALGPASANAGTLQLDPQHTSVAFRVRHLFTKVNGQFRKFQGSFQFDEASLRLSEVNAAIDVASVDTNVEARDNDLRSKRFFDAEKYPQMTFKSSAPLTLNGNQGQLQGLLTIHGVEKEVVLEVEYLGKAKDPWGNLRYGFHAATTINRKDFGMKWNEILETGGVLVGDEVEVVLDIEAVPAT
jgi:polyisoprenoid-binding protein YceI